MDRQNWRRVLSKNVVYPFLSTGAAWLALFLQQFIFVGQDSSICVLCLHLFELLWHCREGQWISVFHKYVFLSHPSINLTNYNCWGIYLRQGCNAILLFSIVQPFIVVTSQAGRSRIYADDNRNKSSNCSFRFNWFFI